MGVVSSDRGRDRDRDRDSDRNRDRDKCDFIFEDDKPMMGVIDIYNSEIVSGE